MVDVIRGKYRIVREIARSNDIVYEAVDTTLGRRIALKELNIPAGMIGQARLERIERFNREARAAGKLNHPNIVAVTDCFEENGRYFIVMEYLEGQTLRDVMQMRSVLALPEALGIASQVLDALGHAHQHQVIHRDIKPDNIFILPGGIAKLADFGIARLSEEPALTSNGQVFGTPSYMSPEQIEGRGIDHRSDLFSVGVLLYEMLSGRKPFIGDSVISITYAVMNADPPPMNGVPMGVEQVIRRALSKNPNGRQTSAEQMKQDLRNAEQTPAVFLPSPLHQTGMNRTGLGSLGGYPPASLPSGGYASGYAQPAGGYGYTPAQIPPVAQPQQQAGLPWAWNAPGTTGTAPAVQPSVMPSVFPQSQSMTGSGYSGGVPSMVPYASPPYPAAPSEPLFVLTPGGRTFLLSVLVAAIIGSVIAVSVIGLQNSYSHYQQAASGQRITSLIDQGAGAYNNGDYARAAADFAQALQVSPNTAQRVIIKKNLAYTYVQQARAANGRGDWRIAKDFYNKAIDTWVDYDTPHKELADLLAQHGDPQGAADQRSALSSGGAGDSTPTRLDNHLPAASSTAQDTFENAPPQDPQQFVRQQREEARQLVEEGKDLLRRGRLDEARDRWQTAIEKAPGTPERDAAAQLLDQNPPPPSDPGY